VTADAVTLKNLTFGADGYEISGGPLLMCGGPTVAAGCSAVLTATVTNNVGICEKGGTGTLVLDCGTSRTNRFSTLRVTQGTLQITGGTHEIYTNDANNIYIGLDINGGTLLMSGGKIRFTSTGYSGMRGTFLITNGIVDLSSSREFLNAFNGAGTTTVSGNGVLDVQTLRISQNTGSQNAVNVNTGGIVRLQRFAIDTGANPKGSVNFNGGTVVVKSSTGDFLGNGAAQWLNGISARILAGGAVIDTGAYAISIKQPLVSGAAADGGLTKTGTGTLSLATTNSYNGGTTLSGGSLNVNQDKSLGAAPTVPETNLSFVGNGTLQSGGTHALDANRTVWVTNAVTATFDTQSYTQTVFGTVVCAETNANVVKSGSGLLVLDPGAASENRFGTLHTTAGTLVLASGTNLVTCPNKGQNAPGLRISGGTLLVAGGLLKTTAGLFVNVDGGHLLVTNGMVDATSCYEILNGIGGNGYGYTTVSGSGEILANAIRISQNTGNPSNNVVSVNTGGVMRVNNFYIDINFTGAQKGMLFLNGGTVEPRTDNANFLGTTETLVGNNNDKWLTNIFVHVREGGAIFNTAGKNISIKQPLYSGAANDGGLTKKGAGTLTLLNTNTYNGATSVEGGTLKLGVATNTLLSNGSAFVSSNAVLDINNKVQTLAGLGGSGTVTNNSLLTVTSAITPGGTHAVGTLTLASACSLSGALNVEIAANGACDRLHVQGSLDLSALALNVALLGPADKYAIHTVATCTGTLSGSFASSSLPTDWLVRYDTANRRVYLIHQHGTLIQVR
jgi:autotransporter-associated beta strand protein